MHSDSDLEDLDAESQHLWRAEEEAAEEEIRMAEEAAAEELWMAEEAAAQAEMAELEEFAQEAEGWLNEELCIVLPCFCFGLAGLALQHDFTCGASFLSYCAVATLTSNKVKSKRVGVLQDP